MHETIQKSARRLGFSTVYFLSPLPLERWRDEAVPTRTDSGMDWDVPSAFPRATCVVLLVWPYLAYWEEQLILPYYLAENRAYFQAKAFAQEISRQGFYCENAWLPIRALTLENGVGSHNRNGLLSLNGFGTRVSLFALTTNACEALAYPKEADTCPSFCDACIRACPTGAITKDGLDATKCLRYDMDHAAHPPFILEKLPSYLGCDLCQRVCPKNVRLQTEEPSLEIRSAFDRLRLIRGDAKGARTLVGKNITGNGKLTVEAIALAAREQLFEDDIRADLCSPYAAVRDTARWALEKYF